MLSPKAYLFMLAVFVKFLPIEYGSTVIQAVIMGLIIVLTQTAVYGAVVMGASSTRGWLHSNQIGQQWLKAGYRYDAYWYSRWGRLAGLVI